MVIAPSLNEPINDLYRCKYRGFCSKNLIDVSVEDKSFSLNQRYKGDVRLYCHWYFNPLGKIRNVSMTIIDKNDSKRREDPICVRNGLGNWEFAFLFDKGKTHNFDNCDLSYIPSNLGIEPCFIREWPITIGIFNQLPLESDLISHKIGCENIDFASRYQEILFAGHSIAHNIEEGIYRESLFSFDDLHDAIPLEKIKNNLHALSMIHFAASRFPRIRFCDKGLLLSYQKNLMAKESEVHKFIDDILKNGKKF